MPLRIRITDAQRAELDKIVERVTRKLAKRVAALAPVCSFCGLPIIAEDGKKPKPKKRSKVRGK